MRRTRAVGGEIPPTIGLARASLASLRASRDAYVDKTSALADLLAGGMCDPPYAFFARPRKFGKSLTLDVAAKMLAAGALPEARLRARRHRRRVWWSRRARAPARVRPHAARPAPARALCNSSRARRRPERALISRSGLSRASQMSRAPPSAASSRPDIRSAVTPDDAVGDARARRASRRAHCTARRRVRSRHYRGREQGPRVCR